MLNRIKQQRVILFLTILIILIFSSVVYAAEEPKELIVSVFGGAYTDALKEKADLFEQEYNCKIIWLPGSGTEGHVRARNREADVVQMDAMFSARGVVEDLYVELDEASIPNLNNIYDKARISKYYVATDIGFWIIGYNPKYVPQPTSWFDLAKPEYKGKVSMRSFRDETISLIVLLAKLEGGDERNIDTGFKKMAEISKNIDFWYTGHPEALTLMKEEKIWFVNTTDGRLKWMQDEGASIESALPKEGYFTMFSTISVVKDRPYIELAKAFVNWRLSVDAQLSMARLYSPVNKNVEIPDDIPKILSHDPELIEKATLIDWEYAVTVLDEWNDRWEKEIVQ